MRLVLEASSWNVTPTAFQRESFPRGWQDKISCLHDGINTVLAAPSTDSTPLTLPNGIVIAKTLRCDICESSNRTLSRLPYIHQKNSALQREHAKAEIDNRVSRR